MTRDDEPLHESRPGPRSLCSVQPTAAMLALALLVLGGGALGCGRAARDAARQSSSSGMEHGGDALVPGRLGGLEVHALGGVYTAGQPTAEELAAARAAGVRTVVDLREPGEDRGYDEAAAAAAAGLAYVPLPWNGAEELTDEVFERARELLRTAERPILLHCASANRVGALWIPYRVLDGGVTLDAAVAEAKAIGLRSLAYEAKARDHVARARPR